MSRDRKTANEGGASTCPVLAASVGGHRAAGQGRLAGRGTQRRREGPDNGI